jgi:hypothetical protein
MVASMRVSTIVVVVALAFSTAHADPDGDCNCPCKKATGPVAEPAPASSPATPRAKSKWKPVFIGAAATAGAAIILDAFAWSKLAATGPAFPTYGANCLMMPNGVYVVRPGTGTTVADCNSGHTYLAIADVAVLTALAAGGVAGFAYFRWRRDEREITVAPAISPGAAGATVRVSW